MSVNILSIFDTFFNFKHHIFKVILNKTSSAGERTTTVPAETRSDETRGEVWLPSALVLGVWVEAGWVQPCFLARRPILVQTTAIITSSLSLCYSVLMPSAPYLQVTTLWITELHLVPSRRWWRTPSTPGTVCSAARQPPTHWAEVQLWSIINKYVMIVLINHL